MGGAVEQTSIEPGCEDMPQMDMCALVVSMKDGSTEKQMKEMASTYAPSADFSLLKSIHMVTLSFGSDNEECCKAYDLIKTRGDSLIENVEFDSPMSMASPMSAA